MNLKFWKRNNSKKETKQPKSALREWGDALMFALVAASIIRWATFEAYAIPTSSMEKSLQVGDFLFVSKLHYGSRTPLTPLQLSLTHQTIWGTDISSYSDAIQLPSFRLPGFSKVKHNDPVVFNYPPEKGHPLDLKTYYIKRCVGLAGDTFEIRDMQVYINGKTADTPEQRQHKYFMATDKVLNNKFFHDRDITDVYPVQGGYVVETSPAKAEALATLTFVQEVKIQKLQPGQEEFRIFPQEPGKYKWNRDNFGPLYVPAKGATVTINPNTLPLYEKVILEYEGNEDAEVIDRKLYLNGRETASYTFKQNYYFMMGDNRHNSADSRYWGFVPEDHLVGKAVFVWMSIDPVADSFLDKIRWNRLFQSIP
ncbi:signal peptidase I [Pontibacter harenae]|uniref:signal peptidase I n=1 Tax=Pontibacter harenae TaxID=2894083 RepID=UPI001E351960|nr:signal peptidase I [Pontibacter harenae]MCC9166696.1 signal peptidase I [Pontibacter harenae]